MKTHFNDPEYAKKAAWLQSQAMHIFPPPIPFPRKKTKKDKDDDKHNYREIEVPIDQDTTDTTEWKVYLFEQGDPEDWIKWRIQYEQFAKAFPLDTQDKQHRYLLTLLTGRAKDLYTTKYSEIIRTKNKKPADEALNALALDVFNNDQSAWRRQRNYLRYNLFFQQGELKEFKLRLYEQNKYLKYFPVPRGRTTVTSFDDDELLEIIDRGKPIQYQQDCLKGNIDPYTKTSDEYLEFLERLETSARIDKALEAKKDTAKPKPKKGKGKQNKRKKRPVDDDSDVVSIIITKMRVSIR